MLNNKEDRGCSCGTNCNFNTGSNNMTVQPINFMNVENSSCGCDTTVREEMIRQIRELDFAIVELAEYLDTHPDSPRALCLHKEYCRQVKDLKDKYQKVYGPLSIYFPCNKWRWLEEPWPWERGNF